MTWNPSVTQAPIIATSRSTPRLEAWRRREMEGAAVAVITMLMAVNRKKAVRSDNGQPPRQQSAWVVQGRLDMTTRWFN